MYSSVLSYLKCECRVRFAIPRIWIYMSLSLPLVEYAWSAFNIQWWKSKLNTAFVWLWSWNKTSTLCLKIVTYAMMKYFSLVFPEWLLFWANLGSNLQISISLVTSTLSQTKRGMTHLTRPIVCSQYSLIFLCADY